MGALVVVRVAEGEREGYAEGGEGEAGDADVEALMDEMVHRSVDVGDVISGGLIGERYAQSNKWTGEVDEAAACRQNSGRLRGKGKQKQGGQGT